MHGPYAGTEVSDEKMTGIAHPSYTPEELALLREAEEILQRAWEGGHFSDIVTTRPWAAPAFGKQTASLAELHRAAERAQALVPEGVSVIARSTALGDWLLVGLKGRP